MDFAPDFQTSSLYSVKTSATITGTGISADARVLSFRKNSRETPVVHAVVEFAISGFTSSELARFSPLEISYARSGGVVTAGRPALVTLRLDETVESSRGTTTRTRTEYLHVIKASMMRDVEAGQMMRLELASIDAVMSLTEVLWEGQISENVRFAPGTPVDTTWNANFNTNLSRAADWSYISAETGLTWSEYDAPGASASVSIPDNEPLTLLDVANSVAQLWGRYVTQGTSYRSWATQRFVRDDLPVIDLTAFKTIISETYATNSTDWGDIVDFEWIEKTPTADGGIDEVRHVRRVGSRNSIMSNVIRVPIRPEAARVPALLEAARDGINSNRIDASVTSVIDITAQLGQKVTTIIGERYIAGFEHDFEAGTTTLELRYQFPTIETAPVQTFTIQADGYDWDVSSWTPKPVPPFVTLTYSNLRFNAPATHVTCSKSVRSGSSTLSSGTNLAGRDLFLPANASGSYVFTVTT